jgi:hypothetical protein
MSRFTIFIGIIALLNWACTPDDDDTASSPGIEFYAPQPVAVNGYEGQLMEPFLSRDGNILFFNNLNDPSVNTNLHWCTRINDTVFQYEGELEGINTTDLEGVPTMDENRTFYFVYDGAYDTTLSTIYRGYFFQGEISHIERVENISRNQAGWLNFDVEVSGDGATLYFVDGRFDANGGPYESNIVVATTNNGTFERLPNTATLMKNINTSDLEYAAAISDNQLEIFGQPTGDLFYPGFPPFKWQLRTSNLQGHQKPCRRAFLCGSTH